MTLSYIPSDTNDEGILKATASGILPSGQPVIVNADGTVSVVAGADQAVGSAAVWQNKLGYYASAAFDSNSNKVVIAYYNGTDGVGEAVVGTVSGTSISFGNPVAFSSAAVTYVFVTFDSSSNKIVLVYRDGGNSNYGTAAVGTVNGTSISFGSSVVFNAAATQYMGLTFDSNSNKVVIAYRDQGNSNYGTAIVGTVSSTSISFGSPVIFNSAATVENGAAFDSNSNKVVIAYRDVGNSNIGTAIVGTVSSTSISFGSEVAFCGSNSLLVQYSTVFDSNSNKIVICYPDLGNSSHGTAVVGDVSGTSISFGTPVVFEAASTGYPMAAFDSNANKVSISYTDAGNSGKLTIISGNVSGTSISFGDPQLLSNSNSNLFLGSTFDSNSNKVVTAYADGGNSNYGTAVVFQNESTTLTAENYIGISTGGTYASGSNATVKIIGNTSNEQSSLTAGQSYFVQTDGTIGTTAADPSVFAGTAISATKLLVKT